MRAGFIFTAILIGLLGGRAHAAEKKVLDCPYVQTDDIESIEGFNAEGKGRIVVHDPDGEKVTTLELKEEISLDLEGRLPLPDAPNGASRELQLRHTGWAINTYDKGVISHDYIDCTETP